MPTVIEAPETVEETLAEIRELPSYKSPQPASAPRLGFITKMTALLANVAPLHKQHSGRLGLRHKEEETPLNILAREHPYTYIKAMAG